MKQKDEKPDNEKDIDRVADIFGKTLGVPVNPEKIKSLLATLKILHAAGYEPLKKVEKSITPSSSYTYSPTQSSSQTPSPTPSPSSSPTPIWRKRRKK